MSNERGAATPTYTQRSASRFGTMATVCMGLLLAPGAASAAVTFGAGAGASLTISSIFGDPAALAATSIVGTEVTALAVVGGNGPDDEHSFELMRTFTVDPHDLGSAQATVSTVALSVSSGTGEPGDGLLGANLVQLAQVEGAASAVGPGAFAGATGEAHAFGAYEISNGGLNAVFVQFDYEVGIAALTALDDPMREAASALGSVEISAGDAESLVFANAVSSTGNGAAEASAIGSFIVEIAGVSSLVVGSVSKAFGEATVVPLPGAAGLLLAGLGALGALRARRSAPAG